MVPLLENSVLAASSSVCHGNWHRTPQWPHRSTPPQDSTIPLALPPLFHMAIPPLPQTCYLDSTKVRRVHSTTYFIKPPDAWSSIKHRNFTVVWPRAFVSIRASSPPRVPSPHHHSTIRVLRVLLLRVLRVLRVLLRVLLLPVK